MNDLDAQPAEPPSPGDRDVLDRQDLALAISAWRHVAACSSLAPAIETRAIRWLKAVWEQGASHIPFTFVVDLGALLLLGKSYPFRHLDDVTLAGQEHLDPSAPSHPKLHEGSDVERESRMASQAFLIRYQDRVVAHWLAEPSVRELHVHIAGLDVDRQDLAIAHAITLALGPPLRHAAKLIHGNAAVARGLTNLGATVGASTDENEVDDDVIGLGGPAALESPVQVEWNAWAQQMLTPSVDLLAHRSPLFSPEDLWEVTHLDVLPSESTRLALRQIHHIAGLIGTLSSKTAIALRQRVAEVPIEEEDASNYPTGGFDAVSTQGAFENLVRSEIAYVGESVAELGAIDLFDLRFVEGELLFYTRDESPVFDTRRAFHLVIDEPERLRTKVPGALGQTGVVVLGFALALQADTVRAFGAGATSTSLQFHCRAQSDVEAADEELRLLSISWAAERLHRRVTLLGAQLDTPIAVSRFPSIVFSLRPAPTQAPKQIWIRVDGLKWTWDERVFDGSSPRGLRALADSILQTIAGGQRRLS